VVAAVEGSFVDLRFWIPITDTIPPRMSSAPVRMRERWKPLRSTCAPITRPTNAIAMRPATRLTALLMAEPMPVSSV